MKKKCTHIILFVAPIIAPLFTFAETSDLKVGLINPISADSVSEVMLNFFQILIELGAVVVTLAIIYAGFLFVMAKGNPEELNKAKTTLFWTIIGSLVLLGAQVIADIIEKTIKQL
jgi:hypothetical protein